MATITLGTASTTTLMGLVFSPTNARSDVASIAAAIKDDKINSSTPPVFPGAFDTNGLLYVPNRGWLRVLPGDLVAVGSTSGWPILLSANAASSTDYVHT